MSRIDGVAKSKGTPRGEPGTKPKYQAYSKAKVKNYAGQARAKAAARLKGAY